MNEMGKNIYKDARIRAGLKREPAAEELHIDVRTLDKYEALGGKAPDEIVKAMCMLYNNRFLGYQHLKLSPLGEFLPDLEDEGLQAATLSMVDDFYGVEDALKGIIRIAADGKINDNERLEWEKHKRELMELLSSLMSLLISDKEGEDNQ